MRSTWWLTGQACELSGKAGQKSGTFLIGVWMGWRFLALPGRATADLADDSREEWARLQSIGDILDRVSQACSSSSSM